MGYVKQFDYADNLKFEGEDLNGEKNGKGKEYNTDGTIRFEGELTDENLIKFMETYFIDKEKEKKYEKENEKEKEKNNDL